MTLKNISSTLSRWCWISCPFLGAFTMLSRVLGQVRYRRYRPFKVVKKVPWNKKVVTTLENTVTEKTDASTPTIVGPDESLFQVGPLQAMRLIQAFAPLSVTKNPVYINLSLTLDIDVRRQSVRGVTQLPHGLKTNSKLLVFCSDFDAQEMLDAGADFAGMSELLQRIGKGWTGFDRCIATPAVMPQVMKVAKVLGPRKLMPNPKSGTLVTDLKKAIIESKSGAQIEYRTLESEPRIDVRIGSLDAPMASNLENMKFFVREVLKQKSRSTSSADDSGDTTGRLVSVGGLSMIPNIDKLNKILLEKRTSEKSNSQGKKASNLFIQAATIRLGDDGPTINLDPETILPSSSAYYR